MPDYVKLKKDLILAFIEFEYVERFAVLIHQDVRKQAMEMYKKDPSARKHIDGIIDKMIKIFRKYSVPSYRGETPINLAYGKPLPCETVRNEFGDAKCPDGWPCKYISGLEYNQPLEHDGKEPPQVS